MRLTRRQALIVAVACGLLAALLSYLYLKRPASYQQQVQAPKTVEVIVATQQIETGTRISTEMVQVKSIPEDQVPKGAITQIGEATGRVAIAPIKPGDILTDKNVRKPTSALGLSFLVPEGMRAVTVAVDEVSGVGWLVKPGDRVDVLGTFELPNNVTVARIVLQDVELLAIGSQVVPEEEPTPAEGEGKKATQPKRQTTATLAVTPEEAQKLILADTQGKLRLALRRAGDSTIVPVRPVSLSDLTGYRPPPPEPTGPSPEQAQPQQPPPWYQQPAGQQPQAPAKKPKNAVEVVRGGQREVIVP